MAVYIISRDAAADGSGLIIKSSFNCILLHYNDVSELARPALSMCICMCLSKRDRGEERDVGGVHLGTSGIPAC